MYIYGVNIVITIMREFLIRFSRLALFFAICWIVFWLPEFYPGISKPVAYIACALIALIGVTMVFFAKIDDEVEREVERQQDDTLLLEAIILALGITLIVYSAKVKPLLPFAIAAVLMVAARIALGFCEKRYKGLTVKEFFAREITLPLMMDVLLLGSSVYYIFKPGHAVWFNGLVALLAVLDIARHGLRNRM